MSYSKKKNTAWAEFPLSQTVSAFVFSSGEQQNFNNHQKSEFIRRRKKKVFVDALLLNSFFMNEKRHQSGNLFLLLLFSFWRRKPPELPEWNSVFSRCGRGAGSRVGFQFQPLFYSLSLSHTQKLSVAAAWSQGRSHRELNEDVGLASDFSAWLRAQLPSMSSHNITRHTENFPDSSAPFPKAIHLW